MVTANSPTSMGNLLLSSESQNQRLAANSDTSARNFDFIEGESQNKRISCEPNKS